MNLSYFSNQKSDTIVEKSIDTLVISIYSYFYESIIF